MFALLALLRCRGRLESLLEAVAEPRRSELARVAAGFDGLDDASLRQQLAETIRHEDDALRDAVVQVLGAEMSAVPVPIRRWAARSVLP
jgi:hypothetical protein